MGSAQTNNPSYLYSRADGDKLVGKCAGLARLTPSVYYGDSSPDGNGVAGYMAKPQLNHFRAQVGQILRAGPPPSTQTKPARYSTILDIDSRNLYFGQNDIAPAAAGTIVGGDYGDPLEGNTVAGLPVRLQQVSFRGFTPRGGSDEYSAFFLVSSPVGKLKATTNTSPTSMRLLAPEEDDLINSDYKVHEVGNAVYSWTNNDWMPLEEIPERKRESVYDFNDRLIIGDPLRVDSRLYYRGHVEPATPVAGGRLGVYSVLYHYSYYDALGFNDLEEADGARPKISTADDHYKENVYNLRVDETSLITRQTATTAGGQGQNPRAAWENGWNYAMPLEASVAARWTFYTGKYMERYDAGYTKPPDSASDPKPIYPSGYQEGEKKWCSGDHWDVKYHTQPVGVFNETHFVDTTAEYVVKYDDNPNGNMRGGQNLNVDGYDHAPPWNWKIMRRFKPGIGLIYGCLDGNNWTLIKLIGSGGGGGGLTIPDIKTYYSTQIVQGGSWYSFEVELIDSEYQIRGGWVHAFNKSVAIGDVTVDPTVKIGATKKIWLRIETTETRPGDLPEGDAKDEAGTLDWSYHYGDPPDGKDADANNPYVVWYLIADTTLNWGKGNERPVKQHVMGDIYDRNASPPKLWPNNITEGNIYDVLQLDAKDGPPTWYTLRAQSFFAEEQEA